MGGQKPLEFLSSLSPNGTTCRYLRGFSSIHAEIVGNFPIFSYCLLRYFLFLHLLLHRRYGMGLHFRFFFRISCWVGFETPTLNRVKSGTSEIDWCTPLPSHVSFRVLGVGVSGLRLGVSMFWVRLGWELQGEAFTTLFREYEFWHTLLRTWYKIRRDITLTVG